MGDVQGQELDLRPFGNKVDESLRLNSSAGDIPDVMIHELKCPLGDPSHGIMVADDVSQRVGGIIRTAKHRYLLIKRMEPLAEENKKLKEVMNLSEKNIQRAQRERDLAESNAWDLKYQKGVLSGQLATAKEQLWSKSEQLITASTQLKDVSEQLEKLQKVSEEKREQDAELSQLRWALEHLREEKTKKTERANKLTEELDATDLEAIGGGYAEGLSKAEIQRLEDEVEDAAKKLAGDIYLFGENDGSGEA
ncbi:uncharacterized protein [Miscanthus floridulus]|uniref:uncharacterized protein n=1 Tax=Miscanthus floridulus TaxID=154761 RepID=UPI003459F95C